MAMEYSIPIPPDQWLSGIEYSMASPPDSCFQAKDTLSRTYFPCTIWISSPDSAGPSELQDIHPPVQQLYSEYLTERCGKSGFIVAEWQSSVHEASTSTVQHAITQCHLCSCASAHLAMGKRNRLCITTSKRI